MTTITLILTVAALIIIGATVVTMRKNNKTRWYHPMSKNYSFNSKEEFIKLV